MRRAALLPFPRSATPVRTALVLLCLAVLGGCLATTPLGLDDWSGLDAPGRRAVAVRLLAESDVTALTRDRYTLEAPTATAPVLVGGFIPGRVPGRRAELVVVGTALGGRAASALLDAAMALAAQARYGQEPERSVLVAFWPRGSGPRDVLALPIWPTGKRHATLWVDADGPPAPGSARESLRPARLDLDPALPRAAASEHLQGVIVRTASSDTLATTNP